MDAPPAAMIEAARQAALTSPCAKSKRGAAVFVYADDRGGTLLLGSGTNGPPTGLVCTGSVTCKASCSQLCIHAEGRALTAARARWGTPRHQLDQTTWHMVHVKVVDGIVVPSKRPSCWQCSRELVEAGIHTMWLLEALDHLCPWGTEFAWWCGLCTGTHCSEHGQRMGTGGAFCDCDAEKRHQGMTFVEPKWVAYTALDFHRATLANCVIEVP